jgi:opacity protein-like surface antigen
MTRLTKRIGAIGLAAACLAAMQARAADMDRVIFADDANFLGKPAELGSGWYLRGDVGLSFNGFHDVSVEGDPIDLNGNDSLLAINNITDKLHYSVGMGYRFSDHLRMDVNFGRLAGTDRSTSELLDETDVLPTDPNPCNGWGTFVDVDPDGNEYTYIGDDFITNCIQQDTVEYDIVYGMANVYADLGTFAGFTPFIGAGVGIGRLAWREELDSVLCVPRSGEVRAEGCQAFGVADQPGSNEPYTQPGIVNEGVDYRIGYSLAAGLGYNINDNITLEMAYRYMNFGAKILSSGDTTGSGLAAGGYGTHQVNLGLRYAIW